MPNQPADEPNAELASPEFRTITDPELAREAFRASFRGVPLHDLLQFEFVETDEPGRLLLEMPVGGGSVSHAGALHGGAIATLVDVACSSCGAMALDFNPVTHLIVTTDLHVRYLGRAKGQTVRADARVIRAGSSMTTVECRVADELGNLVASADMAIMQIPRRDAPGVPSS